MSISLSQKDWLKSFIEVVLQQYDYETAAARAERLPEENRGEAAIQQSLRARGASFGFPLLDPTLSDSQEFAHIKFLSTLKHQAEIVLDVAVALKRPIHSGYGHLALLMLWWANLGEQHHMAYLADLWREVVTGQRSIDELTGILNEQYIPLGEALQSRAVLTPDPLLAQPINQGISYFDILAMGLLGLALHDDERLQPQEVERVLSDIRNDRILCVEATIALAWSNGLLEAEERNLIKKQIELMNLDKKDKRKLLNLMITPSTPKEFAKRFSNRDSAVFVLRQLVIASLIDGSQDNRERQFLQQTSKEFGVSDDQFHQIQNEMKGFVDANKDAIEMMKNNRRVRPTML